MPRFVTEKNLPFSAQAMFDVVADVEKYPEFVPYCKSLDIVRMEQKSSGIEVLHAQMCVVFKGIVESYTSAITLNQQYMTIDVKAIDGPFEYLTNAWQFQDRGNGQCYVRFELDYKFRNRLLGFAMSAVFDKVFGRYMDAFVARVERISGLSS